ncbi:1489_t:CDS:2, partial [Dentiscutata erythropus]
MPTYSLSFVIINTNAIHWRKQEAISSNLDNNISKSSENEFKVYFLQGNHDECLLSDSLIEFENLTLDNKYISMEIEVSNSQKASFNRDQAYSKRRLYKSKVNRSSRSNNSFVAKASQQANIQELSNFVPLQHNYEKRYSYSKIKPLVSSIQETCKRLFIPSSNISIDKMFVCFSGKSVHTVHMKNKPTSEDYKILSLCDLEYIWTFFFSSRIEKASNLSDISGINEIEWH